MVLRKNHKKSGLEEDLTQFASEQDNTLAPPEDQGPTVCDVMRAKRDELRLSLAKISDDLRISQRYLEAIENADCSRLPERVYALGFVRAYARYLGLDAQAMVEGFKQNFFQDPEPKTLIVPKAATEDQRPSHRVLLLSASSFCALCLIGGYLLSQRTKPAETPVAMETELTEEVLHVTAAPMDKAVDSGTYQEPSSVQASSVPTGPASGQEPMSVPVAALPQTEVKSLTAVDGSSATPTPAAEKLGGEQAADLAKAQETQVPAAASTPAAVDASAQQSTGVSSPASHDEKKDAPAAAPAPNPALSLQAAGNVWLELRTADGKVLLSRTLRHGEKIALPDNAAKMTAGNAGALRFVAGEVEGPALGKIGEVKRDLPLDP
ncbi:MAG: helix-turn-helix domain-containing protein, partial [Holosporales bacterium]